jgi:hypothetical protein
LLLGSRDGESSVALQDLEKELMELNSGDYYGPISFKEFSTM